MHLVEQIISSDLCTSLSLFEAAENFRNMSLAIDTMVSDVVIKVAL